MARPRQTLEDRGRPAQEASEQGATSGPKATSKAEAALIAMPVEPARHTDAEGQSLGSKNMPPDRPLYEASARITRNDYRALRPPALGTWTPYKRVTVLVPAYSAGPCLSITLTTLFEQSYPSDLIELILITNGDAEVGIPSSIEDRIRTVEKRNGHVTSTEGLASGIKAASGEIIVKLDTDILVNRFYVEAHAAWHHLADYLVVVGRTALVEMPSGSLDSDRVAMAVRNDRIWRLFRGRDVDVSWNARVAEEQDQLAQLDSQAFTMAEGQSMSFSRDFGAGSSDLVSGVMNRSIAEPELPYWFAENGAVFVPDRYAESWQLGRSLSMDREEAPERRDRHSPAGRVPLKRDLRTQAGRLWEVPYVEVIVDTTDAPFAEVVRTVDSVLGGGVSGISVVLTGVPARDARSASTRLRSEFAGDPRVRIDASPEAATDSPWSVPFRLSITAGLRTQPGALLEMIDFAEQQRLGRLVVTGHEDDPAPSAVLDRTAAVARALRLRQEGEDLASVIETVWGFEQVVGDRWIGESQAFETVPEPSDRARDEIAHLTEENQRLAESAANQRDRAERWKANSEDWKRKAREARAAAEEWKRSNSTLMKPAASQVHSGREGGHRIRRALSKLKRRLR